MRRRRNISRKISRALEAMGRAHAGQASLAILVTSFGIGPLGHHRGNGTVEHRGSTIAVALPPRSQLVDQSSCKWLAKPRVRIDGRRLGYRWSDDRTVMHFGPVSFNGMAFVNTSRTRWANVYASIERAC